MYQLWCRVKNVWYVHIRYDVHRIFHMHQAWFLKRLVYFIIYDVEWTMVHVYQVMMQSKEKFELWCCAKNVFSTSEKFLHKGIRIRHFTEFSAFHLHRECCCVKNVSSTFGMSVGSECLICIWMWTIFCLACIWRVTMLYLF